MQLMEVNPVLPGDACTAPGCNGRLIVYCCRTTDEWKHQYLECNCCGHKPSPNVAAFMRQPDGTFLTQRRTA